MDQLKIKTQFAKNVISNFVGSKLKKKFDDEKIGITINDLDVEHGGEDDVFMVHIDGTISGSSETIKKLISGFE